METPESMTVEAVKEQMLPCRNRDIVVLSLNGLSNKQIAKMYGLTPPRILQIVDKHKRLFRNPVSRSSYRHLFKEAYRPKKTWHWRIKDGVDASTLIEELELSVRAINVLKNSGVRCIGDILEKEDIEGWLMSKPNCGRKTTWEILDFFEWDRLGRGY